MRLLRVFIILFILSVLFHGICLSDEEKDFPKIAFVKNDGANVRAGDNVNFEALCRLETGDPVKIIDKRYSWFKILLPQKAYLYIKDDYVDLASEKGIGAVNAVRVNLRAGPGTKYSILGQVSRPDKVKVVLKKEGWCKIQPPKATAGWIHSTQVGFSLGNIKHVEKKKEEVAEVKIKEAKVTQRQEKVPDAAGKDKKQGVILMLKSSDPNGNLTFSTKKD